MYVVVITVVTNTRNIGTTHPYKTHNRSKYIESKRELRGGSNSKLIFEDKIIDLPG